MIDKLIAVLGLDTALKCVHKEEKIMSLESDYKNAEAKLKALESTSWFKDYQKCKKERDRLKKAHEKDRYAVLSKAFFDELLPIFENCLVEAGITMPVKKQVDITLFGDVQVDEKVMKPLADLVNKYTDPGSYGRELYESNIIISIDELNNVLIGEQGDYDQLYMDETICTFAYSPHMKSKIVSPTILQRKRCNPFLNKITKYQNN